MKHKILSLVLAAALTLGLAAPALAYSTPDFSDVPSDHWAYEAVMKVADAGVIKGTGNGAFSPEDKLTAEMFIVLVGRVVFPDVKAEGADWSGPYVAEAKAKGLLTGTNVTDANLKGDISRYDMAVILAKCAEILKVNAAKADSSKVTDYGDIPNRYTDAVLIAYGSGLIRGDQNGSFNGGNSMTRQEAATVMDRLLGLKGSGSQGGTTADHEKPVEQPEKPTEPEQPTEPQIVTAKARGGLSYYPTQGNGSWDRDATKLVGEGIPFKILYTEDGGEASILMGESETTGLGEYEIEFSVDKELLDSANGQFYLSAQFERDGQLFVTQDLRTDGRKALSLVSVYDVGNPKRGVDINLVPPSGQKWDFELTGTVPSEAMALAASASNTVPPDWHKVSPAGFTVQLVYYPEPNIQDRVPTGKKVILGETTAREDGSFVLPVSIDTVDLVSTENFRIEFNGVYNGNNYFSKESDSLRTLSDIKTESINAARPVGLYHN